MNSATGARTPINGGAPLKLGASSAWLASHSGVLSDSTKHLVFSYEYNPALASIPAGDGTSDRPYGRPRQQSCEQGTDTVFEHRQHVVWQDGQGDGHDRPPGRARYDATHDDRRAQSRCHEEELGFNLSAGSKAPYTIDVQNVGGSDAWNTTITDNIPAGMCAYDLRPTITAEIYAADGVTPVSGPLVPGTDFSVTWNGGTSSSCQMSLAMLTPKAKVGPTQHLIINYQAMLDGGISSGTFTNVAGATRWFSADSSSACRREYDRTLTNGTPGILDFQDACTVTATSPSYYFLKSVEDLTTGAYPAASAFPGDKLRYTLQLQKLHRHLA